MKFKKLNMILILLSLLALFVYMGCVDGFDKIWAAVCAANPFWIAGAVLLMVAYWLLEAVILHLVVLKFSRRQRFFRTLHTSMIGQFFNCITPSASGGQPMQAVHMVKSGVPLGHATCALLIKFMVYQTTLTLYSLVILLIKYQEFSSQIHGFGFLILIGFFISAAVMAGLVCICFFRRFTRWAAEGVVSLLHRLHLVRDKQARLDYIERELCQFHDSFHVIRQNIGMIVGMTALSAVQLTVFYLIPYCIYLSFGLGGAPVSTVLSAQSFVSLMSSFVPLPGAMGGAEFSFHVLFDTLMPEQVLSTAILFWRLITFYLPILTGLFFVAHFRSRKQGTEEDAAGSGNAAEETNSPL
ncbi:MAG: flippase-like domain-containing protein [Clostridiales bacterium]|nr:flippase-like domain-containing protein [Clostridiales bacterium]